MEYRKVGKWGLKISELSLGSWLTFANQLDVKNARKCVEVAFKNGVNFFDTAEAYANGAAEFILGQILKEFKRSDIVVSTKIFWGGNGPNDEGLSKKHLIEGMEASLKRLELSYVDIVYCHRPDPETPIEETVFAIDQILRNGWALYWGTSEWSAKQIEAAHKACDELGVMHPIVEQPGYNMLRRDKVEEEFSHLYDKYGMGLTTFSPLASGLLSGKYNSGIPAGSRLDRFPQVKKWMEEDGLLSDSTFNRIKRLADLAKELNCTLAEFSLAWILKNPHVSSVILGVSNEEQLKENLKAVEVEKKLTEDVMKKVDDILKG